MSNEHEQDLFAPTQGLARAPLFHQGALERGGYGQPDPGSGIQGDASTVPWAIILESGGRSSARILEEPQNTAPPRPAPDALEAAGSPAARMADMGRVAPSIRRASAVRQLNMPLGVQNYQELLHSLTGRSVVADFMIGPAMHRRAGILTHVGAGVLILRDPFTQAQTGCDLHSLRFLTVLPKEKPDGSNCAARRFCQL